MWNKEWDRKKRETESRERQEKIQTREADTQKMSRGKEPNMSQCVYMDVLNNVSYDNTGNVFPLSMWILMYKLFLYM